jgi:hypothetical protein
LGGAGGITDLDDGNLVLSGSETAGLAPLNNYGGTTRTHALYTDSAAIDAGDNAEAIAKDLDFDQRGLDRFRDWDLDEAEDVDIGALELAIGEEYFA